MEISRFFLILFSLLELTLIVPTEAQAFSCSNTTTYTPNSTYQANLNTLLSALSSNATNSNGFYSSSAGQDPDEVHGFYLCRGDLTTEDCQRWVTLAAREIVKSCPVQKVAIIWYNEGFLRFSNRSVSPVLDMEDKFKLFNGENITNNKQQFVELLASTLSEVTAVAAAGTFLSAGKKFAVKDVNYNSSTQRLYALAQCRPDLSTFACSQCLHAIAGEICVAITGAKIVNSCCGIRFASYLFYNPLVVPPPPPTPPAVRLPPPPPPGLVSREKGRNRTTIIVVATLAPIGVFIVLFYIGFCFLRKRASAARNYIATVQSLQFDFSTIDTATQNFANANKLGEGCFGAVYKGTLPNGQEIAVKRLVRNSGQGVEEFKNKVILIAKLQHRNLVKLLGFCLEGEEKMFVYEFVPNKSLDYHLFDPKRHVHLDWSTRYNIIGGVARGILYLHQGSRFKIIHRDLKASNILLDANMNPTISDFGIAKIFGVDQTQGSTSKVIGTYGYMSPEYAMHRQFSTKCDVYSFGVLVLEIISGQKNSFHQTEGGEDLVNYVWKQWRDDTPLNVLDPTLSDGYSRNEVIRCIHIGLLCVQENPFDRPMMETVVLMLDSYSVTLPLPKQPANQGNRMEGLSVDTASITEVYPR